MWKKLTETTKKAYGDYAQPIADKSAQILGDLSQQGVAAAQQSYHGISHHVNENLLMNSWLEQHAAEYIGRPFAFMMDADNERDLVLLYYVEVVDNTEEHRIQSLRESNNIKALLSIFRPELPKKLSNEPKDCTCKHSVKVLCLQCCETFCKKCVDVKISLFEFGYYSKANVCKDCYGELLQQRRESLKEWVLEQRIIPYLQGQLKPYRPIPESALETSERYLNHYALVASYVPLTRADSIARTLRAVGQFGRFGLLAVVFQGQFKDLLEILAFLLDLADSESDEQAKSTLKENSMLLFAGYYQMTHECEIRGNYLQREEKRMSFPAPVSSTLDLLRFYAPFANCVYETTAYEVQLMSKAFGYDLIHFRNSGLVKKEPTFGIFACKETRSCVLAIAGTNSPADVSSDLKVANVPLFLSIDLERHLGVNFDPLPQVHGGINMMAQWLVDEAKEFLIQMEQSGYSITVVGHSLGAAVASVFTFLIHHEISTIHCYGYGCPPCISTDLVPYFRNLVTIAVMDDDIVPRMKISNLKKAIVALRGVDYKEDFDVDMECYRRSLVKGGVMQRRGPDAESKSGKSTPSRGGSEYGDEEKSDEPNSISVEPVLKEEDMFVPGDIVLFWRRRGFIFASSIDCYSETLSKVTFLPNLLDDHSCRTYVDALGSPWTVNTAPPVILNRYWAEFGNAEQCESCHFDFSWYCWTSSNAKARLEKRNCACCGRVVCGMCAQNQVGVSWSPENSEICDECYLTYAHLKQDFPALRIG